MKINLKNILLGERQAKKPPSLVAVTPHRTGERTLLGVENLLQSIAVPEPFSLELAGDMDGVSLLARCMDDRVVKQQLAAHYPQARIRDVAPEEDPMRRRQGELAWGLTLRVDAPEYVPLRTFRDDDLLDPGSDPLLAVIGSLSALRPGERIVARLLLRSLGPEWAQAHQARAHKRAVPENRDPSYTFHTRPLQVDGVTMAVLGAGALAAVKGYLWVQDGEILKASLLGLGAVSGLVVAGWAWWRWKKGRNPVYDPLLIREKVSRIAFDAELQVTAFLPYDTGNERALDLLESVAAAYRHYNHPAGARFKVSEARPRFVSGGPHPASVHPAGPGLFGGRSVLGVREVAALWHPPGEGDETPLVERSGSRALAPSARGVRTGAPVGDATGGAPREINFADDLLKRHHLYVARTRMGKSTLMHHVVAHKLREKAAGRDQDAIIVVDPHADLVAGLLEQVPESIIDKVRLIDLADDQGAPGVNLLDTRIFADRDRTADSVVRVAKGLWEQWGPRMQSILEHTVKTLHEANEQRDDGEQYTILDGLKLLSDGRFRAEVLAKVSDPYLMDWWVRDFDGWHRQYRSEAIAPVQTRLAYYASSKKARAILGQSRSTIDLRETILEGGVLFVSTAQGTAGRDVSALVGASLLNLVDSVIREQESLPLHRPPAAGRSGCRRRDAVHARRRLRVHAQRAGQVRGQFHSRHPEPGQAGRPLPHHAGHHPGQRGMPGRLPGVGQRRPPPGVGAGQGPGQRGRHHVPAGAPLLRAGHRWRRPPPRLLHDGEKAGAGRCPGRGPNQGRGQRLHHQGGGDRRRQRRGGAEDQRVPQAASRKAERQQPRAPTAPTAGAVEPGPGAQQAAQQAQPG